ncbi:ECF RNA polymerase sigma factor EcfG [Methylobacterium iners]|uniref:RNA polymerase sigma factor n=1 Tax=Methylobacterium iners TaxID=418707 RepID=A0ABQ4RYC4_9HYPH|nr:ECF RNA polymerase sigma factor EcfG [Methylobacterium iners]
MFAGLLQQLDAVLIAHGEALTSEMRSGLVKHLPSLRAYALSLTRDAPAADDLVQTTLLKAWQSRNKYTLGTTLIAWLFTIMRNSFYSEYRRKGVEVEDADGVYQSKLSIAPAQGHGLDVADMWRALDKLPSEQRDALVLVAVENLSYDEAAAVMECKVGTIKSRVSRARLKLSEVLSYTPGDFVQDETTKAVLTAAI